MAIYSRRHAYNCQGQGQQPVYGAFARMRRGEWALGVGPTRNARSQTLGAKVDEVKQTVSVQSAPGSVQDTGESTQLAREPSPL